MKNSILLLTVSLLLSLQASSKISLSLNGGLQHSTTPFAIKNDDMFSDCKGKSFAVIGAKFAIGVPRFQFGAGLRYGKTGFSFNVPFSTKPGPTSSSQTGLISEHTSEGRFMMPYLFANYLIDFPKSHLYFGLNAGYVMYGDRTNVSTLHIVQPAYVSTTYENGEDMIGMLSGGVQAGYTFEITNQLGLQLETGINYTRINTGVPLFDVLGNPIGDAGGKTAYLQIPLTAGIVYSF